MMLTNHGKPETKEEMTAQGGPLPKVTEVGHGGTGVQTYNDAVVLPTNSRTG